MDKTKNNFCVELYLTVALIDPYNKTIFNMPPYSTITLNAILYTTLCSVGIVSDVSNENSRPPWSLLHFRSPSFKTVSN